jgi:hypothetical protein
MRRFARDDGQAMLLLAAMLVAVLAAVVLGGVAQGIGKGGREQRAADLGALAGARAMHDAFERLFDPPEFAGAPNPRHLETRHDGDTFAPTRIRLTVRDPATSDVGGHHYEAAIKARAEAELAPPALIPLGITGENGEYKGPFASRQGNRNPQIRPGRLLRSDRHHARRGGPRGDPGLAVAASRLGGVGVSRLRFSSRLGGHRSGAATRRLSATPALPLAQRNRFRA